MSRKDPSETEMLRAAITRVRDLHQPIPGTKRPWHTETPTVCSHCETGVMSTVVFPCPTILALDGETDPANLVQVDADQVGAAAYWDAVKTKELQRWKERGF